MRIVITSLAQSWPARSRCFPACIWLAFQCGSKLNIKSSTAQNNSSRLIVRLLLLFSRSRQRNTVMKKVEEHAIEKRRIVLIGVMTSIRDHHVATIRFALCPKRSLLFDFFECILIPMCEQERHRESVVLFFMKKTWNGFSHGNPCFQRSTGGLRVCFDFWPYPNRRRHELLEFRKGNMVGSPL